MSTISPTPTASVGSIANARDAVPLRGSTRSAPSARSAAIAGVPSTTRQAASQAPTGRLEGGASALWASRTANGRVTQAQLALRYLERLDAELGRLKASLAIAMRAPSDEAQARVQHDLEQVQTTWSSRSRSTQASLDERLTWTPDTPARRSFRIRGLNAEALEARSATDTELLSFSVLGADRMDGAMMAEPGRERGATLRKLEAALAPLGIRMEQVEKDAIVFSAEEAHWPVLSERFVVRGGGLRFPAGQFIRPQLDALPAVMAPQNWAIEGAPSQQRTLHAVESVLDQLTVARARVSQFLIDAGEAHADAKAATPTQVSAFVQAFAEEARSPTFEWLSQVVPAMKGMTRERVMSLLQR